MCSACITHELPDYRENDFHRTLAGLIFHVVCDLRLVRHSMMNGDGYRLGILIKPAQVAGECRSFCNISYRGSCDTKTFTISLPDN
jgi:hypothetical protein